jgi:cytochrome P450
MERLRSYHEKLESMANSLFQLPHGPTSLDLISEFVEPFTAMLTADFLGISVELITQLQMWTREYVDRGFIFGPGPVTSKTRSAVRNLRGEIRRTLKRVHEHPGSDLLSRLRPVFAARRGSELTERQLVGATLQMIGGGFQTTKHSIGNSLLALIQHREALAELAADKSLISTATEEFLRYDGASQAVGRFIKSQVELSGVVIPKSGFLRLALGSANRDPAEFPDPDAINVRRCPNRHVGFGNGPHYCLGANLVRLATQAAIKALLRRIRGLTIVTREIVRDPTTTLRGLRRLQVEFVKNPQIIASMSRMT